MTTNCNDVNTLTAFEADRPKHNLSALCRLTGWSRVTAWRKLAELPHCRVGRFIKFSDNQLAEILRSLRRNGGIAA
jgi:hypothetical protein